MNGGILAGNGRAWGVFYNTLCRVCMLLVVSTLMILPPAAEAAKGYNATLFQQKNIGQLTVGKKKFSEYHYSATTVKKARKQGKVNAAKIYWNCSGLRCTTRGSWQQPSVSACQNLAKLVGPIVSFGRSGHYLNQKSIHQCNQSVVSLNSGPIALKIKAVTGIRRNLQPGAPLPVHLPQANGIKQNSRNFISRLPVDAGTKRLLATGKKVQYLVFTNAFSGSSRRMERRTWRGQILLPDLRRRGRAKDIHIKRKRRFGAHVSKKSMWFIENRDGSLSKQILNSAGRLAGNITFTKDGSLRLGIDLNGDKVADLYELQVSGGERTILFSPAGQAAWEHFLNGGQNPLCAPGANPAAGGYAGGMVSGADKTAMQVVCGQTSGSQGGGGSPGNASGRSNGDPGGRAMDSMCKKVLSQQRGQPGAGGMVMDGPDVLGILIDLLPLDPITSTVVTLYRDRDKGWQETGIDIVIGLTGPFGAFVDASAASTAGDDAHTRTDFVNEDDHDLYAYERESDNGDHPDLAKVKSACAAGSSSDYCGDWLTAHQNDDQPSRRGNTGGNNSDPGPDQQNNPDAALLAMCQARAQGKAMWAANTKDTSYVHQLCENPASQPNPAGQSSSTTLGGSYGSSITLSSYCGQHGGPGTSAQTPGANTGGNGRNCGRTESPGTDGRCHGVGTQFNGGSAGSVNVSYGAVIGFTPFNPGYDPSPR